MVLVGNMRMKATSHSEVVCDAFSLASAQSLFAKTYSRTPDVLKEGEQVPYKLVSRVFQVVRSLV